MSLLYHHDTIMKNKNSS